jgi:hypothetical protein
MGSRRGYRARSERESLASRFFRLGSVTDADQRYAEAVARRDAIRDAWLADGSPLLAKGSTGQLVEHPLMKMLREHDLLAMRLDSRKRHRGPEPSAVLQPSPAAKLRAVG